MSALRAAKHFMPKFNGGAIINAAVCKDTLSAGWVGAG
jgi:hypothetical protein